LTCERRSDELTQALMRLGAEPVAGPTISRRPTPEARVRAETASALDADPEWTVVVTAEGFQAWIVASGELRGRVLGLLRARPVAARGHKAVQACADHDVIPRVIPRSERGAELARLVAQQARPGATVIVQSDGAGSPDLRRALGAAGLSAHPVQPYRWVLPDDLGPAHHLLRATVNGDLDVVAFTSPPAVRGFLEVAADLGLAEEVRAVLGGPSGAVVPAAIGPATAEALEGAGITVPICPLRPRLSALTASLCAAWALPVDRSSPRLELGAREVTVDGQGVGLSELEYRLLASLVRRRGAICPTGVLLREVWPEGGGRRRLEVLASRLRQRIGPLGLEVSSVPKRGYRLERASQEAPHLVTTASEVLAGLTRRLH